MINLAAKRFTPSLQFSWPFAPFALACPLVQTQNLSSEHFVSSGFGLDLVLVETILSLLQSCPSTPTKKLVELAFIAAVFAMQGVGIIFAGLVSMVLSAIFLHAYKAPAFNVDSVFSTQPQADYLWGIVLMLGALPAILTYYWRMKMPETGRYTAIIEGNAKQAAANMGKVLDIELQVEHDKLAQFKAANKYTLFSGEFVRRQGKHLIGTTTT